MFVCTPGKEVLMSALCDGTDNCGGGNDETTALCESQLQTSLSLSHTVFLSAPQTSAGCLITGAAPTLDSVLHHSLMSTAVPVSLDSSKIPTTIPTVLVSGSGHLPTFRLL